MYRITVHKAMGLVSSLKVRVSVGVLSMKGRVQVRYIPPGNPV